MKKSLIAAALAAASFAASAGVTGFVSYDYDRDLEKNKPWFSQHETIVGAKLGTSLGTVDGGIVVRQLVTGVRDDNLGFELGYTNGLKLGPVGVTGRVAYGRVNQVDTTGGGFTGNSEYYSLAAEAALPVTSTVTAFAGFRHRNGLEADTPAASNRYTVGADVTLTKSLGLRVGYAHTRQAGLIFNGVTTAVSYKF